MRVSTKHKELQKQESTVEGLGLRLAFPRIGGMPLIPHAQIQELRAAHPYVNGNPEHFGRNFGNDVSDDTL